MFDLYRIDVHLWISGSCNECEVGAGETAANGGETKIRRYNEDYHIYVGRQLRVSMGKSNAYRLSLSATGHGDPSSL